MSLFCRILLMALLFPYSGLCQVTNYLLEGDIIDEDNTGIVSCYIKIQSPANKLIYAYFNTGDKNTFSTSVRLKKGDTVLITISHLGYTSDSIYLLAKENSKIKVPVTLYKKRTDLKGVTIKAPAYWSRGDTTFYRIDAFKEGEEKKLKDILTKVPGFEINTSGQLLYKRMPVNKIMIDGEEIFADKMELLLNNFPIHVIETIQAIEHQNENKLLKGLAHEEKIFVNIGLNKEKHQLAFGDGEVGIGSNNRYFLNPVLFSLVGKLKVGLVVNWNNTGSGLNWDLDGDLKGSSERYAGQWAMNNYSLEYIPLFEPRWYIKNAQKDNRLQVNFHLTPQIGSQTEIIYLTDRQQQANYIAATLFDRDKFFSREETRKTQYEPKNFIIREAIEWSPDTSQHLKLSITLNNHPSDGTEISTYTEDSSQITSLDNSIINKWWGQSILFEYIKRTRSSKAEKWSIAMNRQKIWQQGISISPDWPSIYTVPDDDYIVLEQFTQNIVKNLLIDWSQFNSTGINGSISLEIKDVHANNDISLRSTSDSSAPVFLLNSGNVGKYTNYALNGIAEKKVGNVKHPFFLKVKGGIDWSNIQEANLPRKVVTPIFDFSVNNQHSLWSTFTNYVNFSFYQQQPDILQLQERIHPIGLNAFRQYKAGKIPEKAARLNYNISWFWGKNLSSGNASFYIKHNFTTTAVTQAYQGFLQFNLDSFLNRPVNEFSISSFQLIPSIFFKALIKINATFNRNSIFIIKSTEVLKANMNYVEANLEIKKNLYRKYFITLKTGIGYNSLRFEQDNKSIPQQTFFNIRSSLTQRLKISENLELVNTTALFNNNVASKSSTTILFMDAVLQYKLRSKPIFLSLKADNITNAGYYQKNSVSIVEQSYDRIPLIKRNIFCGLRYEL